MDYKKFNLRFVVSIFMLLFFSLLFLFFEKYLNFIVLIIYIVIVIETYIFFNKKKLTIIFYLTLSLIFFEIYLEIYYQTIIFLLLLSLIILFDSFSYIFGSIFGKKKIFKTISPNKTYFGFFSGLIISIFLSYILFKSFIDLVFTNYLIFSTLIILFSFIGDIIESYFKRLSNLKNSSYFIPGHGGFFDRFDSLVFTSFLLPFISYIL